MINPQSEQTLAETTPVESNSSALTGAGSDLEPGPKPIGSDHSFVIIVGAFRSKGNANNYIAELKESGTEASIFDRSRSGLYRVTIGAFSQREEAMQLLSSAKSTHFSDAWLLAK
jgi:cell division protein FtsN